MDIVELFAGVGGFRLGFEKANQSIGEDYFTVRWSSQWEPSTKAQHASMIYENRWGSQNHSNENIEEVPTSDIPDHDILVGGFPCQDYSVATTLKNSKGILGKKGVLWWTINRILSEKENKPKYLIFENVDRLLKSPTTQRGRDFAIMLKCLDDLGYAVEWRVINAAEYGMPQRRRRVFFIGYLKGSAIYNRIQADQLDHWCLNQGVMSQSFPINNQVTNEQYIPFTQNLEEVSETFGIGKKISDFQNAGMMYNGQIYTAKVTCAYDGEKTLLKDILVKEQDVPQEYYIEDKDIDKWNYLKGAKKEVRKSTSGFEYNYSEGGMVFPDNLNDASRTIITGEGGKSPSRFKHVVLDKNNRLRRLVPVELERLNMFPDNHTKHDNVSDTKRAFLMGNALVIGIIERLALEVKIQDEL
ncbi:DNA (cytosine-5-)-methyltransferase [Myroides sp. LJL115]